MQGLLNEQVRRRTAGLMLGLAVATIAGVMLAGAVPFLRGESKSAQAAQPYSVSADKSDTGDGVYAAGEAFSYRLRFSVAVGPPPIDFHWHDQLNPLLEFDSPALNPSPPGLTCSVVADTVLCTLASGTPVGTYDQIVNVRVRTSAFTNPACGVFDNELRMGVPGGGGDLADEVISQVEPCAPRNVFRLCKQWEANGSISNTPRTFEFYVDENPTANENFAISNVQEGGPPVCILLQAQGLIIVTEFGLPPGYENPTWNLTVGASNFAGEGPTAEFFLSSNECFIANGTLIRGVEALSVVTGLDYRCTLTFTNRDDGAVVTATPVPTVVSVCANCNRTSTPQAPPPPTSTPVPPTNTPARPTNTPIPPINTPIPPTPTTSVSTQSPALTDAQRTATAVAGARTAAAAITPIAPRTGAGGAAGGAGGALNAGLVIAGLVVLGGGLSLAAARSRR